MFGTYFYTFKVTSFILLSLLCSCQRHSLFLPDVNKYKDVDYKDNSTLNFNKYHNLNKKLIKDSET